MSTDHLEEELLQRYFDHELSNGSAVEVQQHLDVCQDCQKRLQSLEKLHTYINWAAEEMSSEVDFNDIYSGIEATVKKQKQTANVVSLQGYLEKARHKMPKVLLPVAVAVAAAFLFIVVQKSPDNEASHNLSNRKQKPKTVLVDKSRPQILSNSEVIQVDFGDNTGTVFEIALAEGVSTPVVWINDEMEEMVSP